jgi:hypothetical protein
VSRAPTGSVSPGDDWEPLSPLLVERFELELGLVSIVHETCSDGRHGEDRLDRVGEPAQPVDTSDQDVADASGLQIGEDEVTIRHSIPVPTGDQPPGHLLRSGHRKIADPSVGPLRADAADAPGTPHRATHGYKRNGTSSLFAALDTASGR